MIQFISNSSEQTKKIAQDIIKKFKKQSVFALYGNLGSGKTCFTQGLTKALKIKEKISSPTFVILKIYQGRFQNTKLKIYHFDCYRIKKAKEILDLGFKDILKEKNRIIIIEWADRIKKILPKKRIDIWFKFGIKENERKITGCYFQ